MTAGGPHVPKNPYNDLSQLQKDFLKAAGNGDESVIRKILEEDASLVNLKNLAGRTALMYAAMRGQKSLVKWLLKKGAVLEEKDDVGRTAFIWAAADGNIFTAEKLLDMGADINMRDERGRTALMEAALYGFNGTVTALLRRGADVMAEDNLGQTALSEAKRGEKKEVIHILEKWIDDERCRAAEKKEKQHEQWLSDTDFSKGIKKPLRVRKPLGPGK